MPRGRKPGSKNKKVISVTDTTKTTEFTSSINSTEIPYKDTRTDCAETCITHIAGEDKIIFYSTEIWGRNFIKKILEEHRDEVEVLLTESDGIVTEITLPFRSMKYIKWPTQRTMSDEQREAASNRLKSHRIRKKKEEENNEGNLENEVDEEDVEEE